MVTTSDNTDRHDESSSGSQQRVEEFQLTGALSLDISAASGDISISRSNDHRCVVRMTTHGSDSERRLREVELHFDDASQSLRVVTLPHSGLRTRRLFSSWRDVDLSITVPAGTSLTAKTASGDVVSAVDLERVTVSSASGDIRLERVTERFRANTASGDVTIDTVGGPCTVRSVSGDIEIVNVSGDLDVRSVSGDLDVGVNAPLDLSAGSISGNVVIRVAKGLVVDVNATTLSGRLRSEIDLEHGATDSADDRGLRVAVRISTVSGDARISRK